MNQSIHKTLGNPEEFPGLSQVMDAAEDAVDFYWDDWEEYETDREGLVMHAAQMYANRMFPEFMANMRKMMAPIDEEVNEDLDLGHEDNEPHMLKADLYRIGKYAMELYQILDGFEGMGEVDLPSWWQAKIINSKDALVSAKHYLDFELKEPQIDAMINVAQEEDVIDDIKEDTGFQASLATPNELGDEAIERESASGAFESLIKKVKEEITVKEGLPKGYWDKKMDAKDEVKEDYDSLVNKIKKQGKSEKAAKAIAGAVASYKAKGGGSGPTAKQK